LIAENRALGIAVHIRWGLGEIIRTFAKGMQPAHPFSLSGHADNAPGGGQSRA